MPSSNEYWIAMIKKALLEMSQYLVLALLDKWVR